MSRNTRKCLNSSFFHVMVQGVNKEYIFNSNVEKQIYMRILKESVSKFNVNIISYCVMSNHVHLLIKTAEIAELSNFMHKINTTYAMIYNKRKDRVGHVFRNRFKSQQINDLKQLYCCINYIHNNPVKASMCTNKQDYMFSSYREYLYNNEIINEKILREYMGENYLKELKKYEIEKTFEFIEADVDKSIICENIIKEYVEEYQIEREKIKYNKDNLIELVKRLQNYGISYRIMEEKLEISREAIRKQLKKIVKEG